MSDVKFPAVALSLSLSHTHTHTHTCAHTRALTHTHTHTQHTCSLYPSLPLALSLSLSLSLCVYSRAQVCVARALFSSNAAEFAVYFCVLAYGWWGIGASVYSVSVDYAASGTPRSGLRPGWLFARPMDLKDGQYSSLRSQFEVLGAVAVSFVVCRHVLQWVVRKCCAASRDENVTATWRVRYYCMYSLVFLLVMHGG